MGFQCAPKVFICSYIFIYNPFNVENFTSFVFFFFEESNFVKEKCRLYKNVFDYFCSEMETSK